MKTFLPVKPGAKKGMLFLLIGVMSFGNIQANLTLPVCVKNNAAYILAAGMGVSAAWAFYEKMSKKSLKAKADKLQGEVDAYKADDHAQEYLVATLEFIRQCEHYLTHAHHFSHPEQDHESRIENGIAYIRHHINLSGMTLEEFNKKLNEDISNLHKIFNNLVIKGKNLESKQELAASFSDAAKKVEVLLKALSQLEAFFELHIDYIKLLLFVDKDMEQEYAQEIKYAHAKLNDWPQLIDQIIRSKGNQTLFPYLFYAQHLTLKLDELSHLLNNLSKFKPCAFQEKMIARAQHVYNALHTILQFVAVSENLVQEKTEKVEYDRKQQYVKAEMAERNERLRLETKEREAKIAQQNAIAEARLVDQKNRERELLNEKASLEKEKRQVELQSQENALQLARIHEGHGIRKALDENNNKWRADYDRLHSQHQKSEQDLKQREIALKDLRIKVSKLESEIKSMHSNKADLERYTRNLEAKVHNISQALAGLEQSASRPPFNPGVIDELPGYINNIVQQVRQLKLIVS